MNEQVQPVASTGIAPVTTYPNGRPAGLAGEVVSWELKDAEKVPLSTVSHALRAAGLDEKYAKDMRARQAFTRAANDLQDKRVIRITDQDDKEVHFQFNKEEQSAGKYQFPYECEVTLNKATGVVSCPQQPELEESIQQLINRHMQERTPADVSKIVQAIFSDQGDLFPVVPSKGVAYVVPAKCFGLSDQVADFLTTMGGKLHRFPVPQGNSESLDESVRRGLEDMISGLRATTSEICEKTRPSTAKKHLAAFAEAASKVQRYAEHLELCKDALLLEIEEARKTAVETVERIVSAGE